METDQILSRTSLKPTAPEFVPSSTAAAAPAPDMDAGKEARPPPETVPESPEDSDDDVHVVLRTDATSALFRPPPMQHRDTVDSLADSIASTDSDRDSPVRDKDDSANLGDRSDTGSEAGSDDLPQVVLKQASEAAPASGADDELPPFEAPDEELARRIVDQVEFYFSDVNITKDAFLLKHVKRNKEGYVSLKLISSFKRVKHLARDWRVVAYALKQSDKLEINEAGTKLRRVDALPAYDQTTPSRTVVAINLPHDKPTIESVAELFRCCGDIALVRILRPGNPIPADVRAFVAKHPEMHGVVSALVEFVRTESALVAVAKRDWDWRYAAGDLSGMRVLELNAPVAPAAPPKKRAASKKNILGKEPQGEYADAEAERYLRSLGSLPRRGSSPMDCLPGKHWLQRRYSRDSGCEDGHHGYHRAPSSGSLYGSGSEYSRSRSNSAASFDLSGVGPGVGVGPGGRRLSAGWDSGSESCCSGMGSARSSRSNSAAFIMDGVPQGLHGLQGLHGVTALRRCSAGKDSDSDGYGSFRSRKSSAGSDMGSLGSRRDSGASTGPCYIGGRRGSAASTGSGSLDEDVYLGGRRGSGHQGGGHHLEHQLLRRMAALGLGGEHHGHHHGHHHHHDCCSCSCQHHHDGHHQASPPGHGAHHAPPGLHQGHHGQQGLHGQHGQHGQHGPQGFMARRNSAELSRKPGMLLAAAAAAAAASASQPVPGERGEHTAVRRLSGAGIPENIMRMPRGPDGGRGFSRENDIPEVC